MGTGGAEAGTAEQGAPADAERLRPYVASLALTWLRDTPDATWREVEGTLVFADISGFTRLTERLANRGKGGAEEMSGILDATFAELLWVAYGYGAQLVKWGGDAVLLLFTGAAHAPRACRAAHDMRRTMGRIGHLRTSAGNATLRMSVGIHSGAFHFFLVGSRHRELVITGPGATAAARIEAVAEAGEIGLSPTTAALLDPSVVGAEKAPGVLLLRAAPAAPATPRRDPFDVSGIPVAEFLPAATREHLLAGGTDGEHRQVAVAFVEFRETDGLLAAQGPAALAAALHHVVAAAQQACARHGVTFWETDISPDGGKIMLVGGAPRSTSDDAAAMLATARDLVDAGGPLPVRVGVNFGRVFAGDFGPDYRRTYSVKGDAVNLSARVMGKARPGEIWATAAAVGHSRLRFAAAALPPFTVKGKAQPVQAYRVGGVLASTGDQAGDELPLVGRDRELATLRGAAERAAAGEPALVAVVGEPGIGKSRLVLELRRQCPQLRQLHVVCDGYHAATPYAPFRTLLRGLLDVPYDAGAAAAGEALARVTRQAAPELVDWLPLLAAVTDADAAPTTAVDALDEKFRKARLEQVTVAWLAALLPTPTLLVVEDVHLVDDASADLLQELGRAPGRRPWAVVVTRRTSAGGFHPAGDLPHTRVDLIPLDDSAARDVLVSASDQRPLRPYEAAMLTDRAQGNPLFLIQLLDAVRQTGSVDGLPDSVEGVITARIDRLSPPQRRLLRAAAVLGGRFESNVLAEVLPGEADAQRLRALDEFLDDLGGGMVAFRHVLVRDTAYEGLPFARRRDLHARAASVLERLYADRLDERADLLSLHFLHAQAYDRAWRYALAAGRRAQQACANVAAAAFYERALTAGQRLPSGSGSGRDLAATWESLGDVRLRLGEFARADDAYRVARQGFRGSPLDLARVQFRTAQAADLAADYPRALRWMSTARRVLDAADGDRAAARLRAEITGFYGLIRHRQGRDLDAVRWCGRAVAEAESVEAWEALAAALLYLDVSETVLGRGDGTNARRALQLWCGLGDAWQEARAHNNLGIRAYFAGRWDEAGRHYDSAQAAAERAGDEWMATIASANVAEILCDQGRLDEAEPRMHEVLRMLRATGARGALSFGEGLLGRLLARQGRYDEALAVHATARALQETDGEQTLLLETDARIVECLAWRGSLGSALQAGSEVLARAAALPGAAHLLPLLYRVQGIVLGALGDVDRGADTVRRSIAVARERQAWHEVAWSIDALLPLDLAAGRLDEAARRERDDIATRLGIVAFPPNRPARLAPAVDPAGSASDPALSNPPEQLPG